MSEPFKKFVCLQCGFEYDEENYSIRGRQSGKVYMLGDKIMVEVAKADLKKRQLDYRLVD